MNMNLNW